MWQLQAASAVFGAVSKYSAASNKAAQDEARYQQNRQNAAVAQNLKISQMNQRMIQEGEKAAGDKLNLAISALKATEASKVKSGESGFSGNTIDALNSQYETQRLRGTDIINQNTENLRAQIEMEKKGVSAETQSRINSLPRGQQPDFMSYAIPAALSVAGAKYGSEYNSIEATINRQLETAQYISSNSITYEQLYGYPEVGRDG